MRRKLFHFAVGVLAAIVLTLSPFSPAAFADGNPEDPPPADHIPIDVPWGG